jgi:hypothetical protein
VDDEDPPDCPVVSLESYRSERPGASAPPIIRGARDNQRPYCRHRRMGVDPNAREVYCRDCRATLDPIEAIVRFATHSDYRDAQMEKLRLEAQIRDLQDELRKLRAQVRREERKG